MKARVVQFTSGTGSPAPSSRLVRVDTDTARMLGELEQLPALFQKRIQTLVAFWFDLMRAGTLVSKVGRR